MKYVVLVPDGAADRPMEKYGGLTPLQAASIPNMDFLARNGRCGTAVTIPSGMPPGSDVANCSIMGYDPRIYYSGRGPLEAASLGIRLEPDQVAFRCNLITEREGVLEDFSAGHISSEESRQLVDFLQQHLGDSQTRFHPGIGYRHLLVLTGSQFMEAACTPPHDVMGSKVTEVLPRGGGAARLIELIDQSRRLLADHPVNRARAQEGRKPANLIWPWGQGRTPSLPTIAEKYGLEGAIITAVDLLKGLGILAGLRSVDVPGATGYYDTDYRAKALYALESLEEVDLVYVHVEAPDEAGHEGDWEAKVSALENFDKLVVGVLLDRISGITEDFRFLLLPDHPTPLQLRTHVADPVPFVLYSLDMIPDAVASFDEQAAAHGSFSEFPGWELLELALGRGGLDARSAGPS
jgi:2,3-bisphosphoglycerate-independent phosphoglycerate mutase